MDIFWLNDWLPNYTEVNMGPIQDVPQLIQEFNGNIDSNNMSNDFYIPWTDWTPTLTVSGGTAPTYTVFINKYTKIGDTVTCILAWSNSSGGTAGNGTNNLNFTLPIPASADINDAGTGIAQIYEESGTNTIAMVDVTTTTAYFLALPASVGIKGNDQSSTVRTIRASFTYKAI